MKIKVQLSILVFMMIGILLSCARGGSQVDSSVIKEVSSPRLFPSTFTPRGTNASDYRDKINWFENNFIQFFTSKGEAHKILGYETPVKVRTAQNDSVALQNSFITWGEQHGESRSMNRYFDVYKRAFNIEVSYSLVSAEYDTALRLSMAANDLPDIFRVGSPSELAEMARAGVIHDLTPYRTKYASEIVEELWGISPVIETATFDGKLYGLPQTWPATDSISYLWIRGDWLQALNLEIPKTFNELINVMDAFMNSGFNKSGLESIGLALRDNMFITTRGLFAGFRAYPEYWIEKNGSLIWGGLDENNKKALTFLNDLYRRGYIDKEFITNNTTRMCEALVNGRCGIAYMPHWYISNVVALPENDPDADFWVIPLITEDGKPAISPITTTVNGYTVVNSKFPYPEIAFKMFNLFEFNSRHRDGTWWGFNAPGNGVNVNELTSFARLYSPWINYDGYESLRESYEAGWDLSYINAAGGLWYGPLQDPSTKWSWDRMANPAHPYSAFRQLKAIVEEGRYFYNPYNGLPSDYMQDRWTSITQQQLSIFTKIITGDLGIDEGFNEWVRIFNSMGGAGITQEVNEWYKNNR